MQVERNLLLNRENLFEGHPSSTSLHGANSTGSALHAANSGGSAAQSPMKQNGTQ